MLEPTTTGDLARSSESLVDALQQGDLEALSVLFAQYRDRVYTMAFHFVREEAAAADITQEVFLKVIDRIHQFRRQAEFTTWLFRIVVNACRSHHRRAQRFVPLDQLKHGPTLVRDASQESQAVRRQALTELRSAICALGPALRVPLLLRYVGGLTYEQIGSVLSLPGGTVASRLGRAHRALEKKLAHLRSTATGTVLPW